MNFAIIGDGYAAQRHKKAIEHVGGHLALLLDPKIQADWANVWKRIPILAKERKIDFFVIASPNYLHYEQCKFLLGETDAQIICEKPLCLPWEPIIDDDRINIFLQLRYIENLPKQADLVRAIMVRNQQFFDSWKGDPRLSGGNFYEFFIHYVDLAILLNADFEGEVKEEGEQERQIIGHYDEIGAPPNGANWYIDIMQIDMQSLYNRMYEAIATGNGTKPKEIFYLKYILDKFSNEYGFKTSGTTGKILIGKGQLC